MRRQALTESLESRRLLAIAVAGTLGNDLIRIAADGESILIVINGAESRFATDAAGVVVNAGDGNDTIRLDDASGVSVTINGQGNDDRVEVGGGDVRNARLTSVSVSGGSGRDTLVVNDATAAIANLAVEIDNPIDTYASIVAAPGSVIRADASTAASAVESVIYSGTALADNVSVLGTNALVSLTVSGANGNDTVIVGNDLDTTIKGPVTLDGGVGVDRLTFDDSADSFIDTYFFAATGSLGTLRKSSGPATIGYTGFGGITLVAGAAGRAPNDQTFRVASLPDVVTVTILAGNGNDALYVGDGTTTLDTLKASLTFDGEHGTDDIIYNDKVGTDAATYEVGPSTITNTGTGVVTFLNAESLTLTANDAANEIRTTTIPENLGVTIFGGGGNDTFRVGNGDIDASIFNGVLLVGGAGEDAIFIDDTTDDAGNDSYSIAADSVAKNFASIFWSIGVADRVESVSLACSANADTIRVNFIATGVRLSVDAGDGNDVLNVTSTKPDVDSTTVNTVTLASGAGRDTLDVNSDGSGADANVVLSSAAEELQDFRVRAGGRVTIAGGASAVLAVRGLLTIGGVVDLASATLITAGSNLVAAQTAVRAGYAGGAWNGAGSAAAITSGAAATAALSDALAIVLASDVGLPTYGGFATAAGDVVVRYTLVGDTNLDRTVDFADLVSVAQHYGNTGAGWAQGNPSYDVEGNVNFDDLVLLAQNYGQTLVP